jgi:hypothetical protein
MAPSTHRNRHAAFAGAEVRSTGNVDQRLRRAGPKPVVKLGLEISTGIGEDGRMLFVDGLPFFRVRGRELVREADAALEQLADEGLVVYEGMA